MKQSVMSVFILYFLAYANGGRAVQPENQSPKQVVEAFCKFETAGGRLTESGWNKAGIWFAHPSLHPQRAEILVTENGYSVWDPVMKGPSSALVIVGVTGDIWRVNTQMRVSRDPSSRGPKSAIAYKLIQTDKHWDPGPDGRSLNEVVGRAKWLIEGKGDTIWLTKESAIHYLAETRDNSKDLVLKRNADQAIASLKRHLR
jgi:hypothetical protein